MTNTPNTTWAIARAAHLAAAAPARHGITVRFVHTNGPFGTVADIYNTGGYSHRVYTIDALIGTLS